MYEYITRRLRINQDKVNIYVYVPNSIERLAPELPIDQKNNN